MYMVIAHKPIIDMLGDSRTLPSKGLKLKQINEKRKRRAAIPKERYKKLRKVRDLSFTSLRFFHNIMPQTNRAAVIIVVKLTSISVFILIISYCRKMQI
jgi:hypothetical protein